MSAFTSTRKSRLEGQTSVFGMFQAFLQLRNFRFGPIKLPFERLT